MNTRTQWFSAIAKGESDTTVSVVRDSTVVSTGEDRKSGAAPHPVMFIHNPLTRRQWVDMGGSQTPAASKDRGTHV